MSVTRERKQEMVQTYRTWLEGSAGLILTSYSGISVRGLDDLRRKVREAGGEFHVVKNRLMVIALREAGIDLPAQALEGATAIAIGAAAETPHVSSSILVSSAASNTVNLLRSSTSLPRSAIFLLLVSPCANAPRPSSVNSIEAEGMHPRP